MCHKRFSISIVSHAHGLHVVQLFKDLAKLNRNDFEVILTLNLPEDLPINFSALPFNVRIINNAIRKGFAENHNSAFEIGCCDSFVIINPDIRLVNDPFGTLLSLSEDRPNGICAPLIVNNNNEIEDSARNFPSPFLLLRKLMAKISQSPMERDIIPTDGNVMMPDWIAGMFMFIPRPVYEKLGGLSERYFLYYEDVDFCARARLSGYEILVSKHVKVIHQAQRDSHRKLRYMMWHLKSALKFFTSRAYLKIQWRRLSGI